MSLRSAIVEPAVGPVLRDIRTENISPKIIIQSSPSSARRYEAPDQEPVVTVIDHQRYESEDRELTYAN